jgi:hypothetical protein
MEMFDGGPRFDGTRAGRRRAARRLSALVGLTILFGSAMGGSAFPARVPSNRGPPSNISMPPVDR